MGMGQPMEHGLKTAYVGLRLAGALSLRLEDWQAIFYGSLLKGAGCTPALPCSPASSKAKTSPHAPAA
jgi:hypothetical protein